MADSPVIRRPSPPIPPPRGAPGNAGARVAGQLSEEVAERLVKDFLAKRPGGLAGKVVDWLIGKDELAVKAVGFSLSEVTREAIFSGLQRLGINTESGLVRALADTPDNVIRGIVEAFAETAQGRANGTSAPAQPAAAATSNVVALVVTSYLVDSFVHQADPGNTERVFCRPFFEAKQAWLKSQHGSSRPTNDQPQGGRGKGRDNRPQNQPSAGKFPQETMTIDQAKQIGLDECPVCKPFTAAGIAAQEASVATQAAAAPAAKKVDGGTLSETAKWFIVALTASVPTENADAVNEVLNMDPALLQTMARRTATRILEKKGHKVFPSDPDEDFVHLLPDTLGDEDVEQSIRTIHGTGVGALDKRTQLKALLDSFTGKKKKAEDEKKKAEELASKEKALEDAEAKVAAATNPVETQKAQEAVTKAKKALEPPPPPPKSRWPLYAGIGAFLAVGIVVLAVLLQ